MAKHIRNSKSGDNTAVETIGGARVPPHSVEAEMAVLGSILLDNSTIPKVLEVLSKESFYVERNRLIFDVIVSMFEKGIQIDVITLVNELQKRESLGTVVDVEYIMGLTEQVPTAENIDNYCRIVQEKYLKRALLTAAGKIYVECYDESVDALEEVDNAERLVFQIAEKRFSRNYLNIKKLTHDAIDNITHLIEFGTKGITGVPTGFIELDRLLGGLQSSDLVVIAARPSVGKTALALSLARNIAVDYGIPVGFFSLEMSAQQLTMRLISSQTGISNHKIRTGGLSQKDLEVILKKITPLSNAPLYIDDSPNISLLELRAKCRRLKTEHKVRAIFVDYLQLIDSPKADSREREISIISRTLKQIAKELDIPIVALSQLNRSVESRADKKPQLSDLRESGSIEQDADVVVFIYRPEVYNLTKWPDKSTEPIEGVAEIIIGKQRNGPTGAFKVVYLKDLLRFDNGEFGYIVEESLPEAIEDDFNYIADDAED